MIAPLALLLALAAPAQAFQVVPAGPGPNRLDVTPALLAGSPDRDLDDLRLRDAQGREVPYLLVHPRDPPPVWQAGTVRSIPVRKGKESGVEVELRAAAEVAALRLVVPARASFIRTLRVEGSVDGVRWTTLLAEGSIYALEDLACSPGGCTLRNEVVRFGPATVRRLRAVFDDRGAAPLPAVARAEVLLAAHARGSGPVVPVAVSRREAEPGTSRFALVLPAFGLPVRELRFDVDARHVFRRAHVIESRLEGGRLVPHTLRSALLVKTEREGVPVSELRVPIDPPEEQELELVVDDGDGGPLALRGASAELEPLPWIYFESADGAPLAATVGDPDLRAPRYDLEAVRERIARDRARPLPLARLGAEPSPAPPRPSPDLPAPGAAALPGAPLDVRAFRVSRAVAAAEPGLAAVRIDAAALAESRGLADVRLAAPDGRQIPYLVESRPEPLTVPLPLSSPLAGTPAARPGATVRAAPIPFGAAPASQLVLETSGRVFTRTVRVHVEGEDGGAAGSAAIAEASWSHADPARPAPRLSIALPAVRGERLLVALDDGDNAPLPLASATLLLPASRLRFFHPGPELHLLYGADGLAPPQYDLELLAGRLRHGPAREVAIGPAPTPSRGPSARTAFWVVLGGAVVGLLALVGRLVGRADPPR